MRSDATIDCLGLNCPMPIIKTAEWIKKISVGQVLEIVADDPGVEEDMPSWCKTTGNEFLKMDKEDDVYYVFIKRTA